MRIARRKVRRQPESFSRKAGYFFAVILIFLVLFFIVYKLSFQIQKQDKIDEEIADLQGEIDRLSQENEDLSELIGYLKTDDFKEREAKDKLNLIKEGEKMVLVKETKSEDSSEPKVEKVELEDLESEEKIVVKRPNYYWWWHYFFSL